MVAERSRHRRRFFVRRTGGNRSENAGMSNEKNVRNVFAENLRIPIRCYSGQGQSKPKKKTKVVFDGKQVKIPAPFVNDEVEL